MISIENTHVDGFKAAIRGCRNPLNSWYLSDSKSVFDENTLEWNYKIGEKDLALMKKLVRAGSDHGKFMRMITVSCDITAPFYFWKQTDTYKVGTTANSCSTMHKLVAKEFSVDDISHEWFEELEGAECDEAYKCLSQIIKQMNKFRDKFLETKSKVYWNVIVQMMPNSYNQKRTWMGNYAVLRNIYHARKNHKLTEWHDFCKWIESLPYSELITEE